MFYRESVGLEAHATASREAGATFQDGTSLYGQGTRNPFGDKPFMRLPKGKSAGREESPAAKTSVPAMRASRSGMAQRVGDELPVIQPELDFRLGECIGDLALIENES